MTKKNANSPKRSWVEYTVDVGLVLLCMYAANPFFFRKIEWLNKFCFYLFSLTAGIVLLYHILKDGIRKRDFLLLTNGMLYMIVVCIISLRGDCTYLVYLVRLIQRLFAMVSVSFLWRREYLKGKTNIKFGYIYIGSILIYLLSTIVFAVNSSFKLTWNSIIVSNQYQYIIESSEYATRFGFAGWSSFDVSIWIASGLVYLFYMYHERQIGVKRFAILSIIMLFGSAMYARSGMVISAILIIIIALDELRCRRKRYVMIFLASFLVIGIAFFAFAVQSEKIQDILNWMFEMAINVFKGKGISSASTSELHMMYKDFKVSLETLLIGDGKWNTPTGYYGNVDVGVLRNILFGGIVYTIFKYGILILLLVRLRHSLGMTHAVNVLSIMIILITVISELKGELLFYIIKLMVPLLIVNVERFPTKKVAIYKMKVKDIG